MIKLWVFNIPKKIKQKLSEYSYMLKKQLFTMFFSILKSECLILPYLLFRRKNNFLFHLHFQLFLNFD